jgi:hypothetical protein
MEPDHTYHCSNFIELVTKTRCRYQRHVLSLFTCMQVVLQGLLVLNVLKGHLKQIKPRTLTTCCLPGSRRCLLFTFSVYFSIYSLPQQYSVF